MAMSRLADDCCERVLRGEKMYIHCWGGHGRTGTLVATMLGRLYSLPFSTALRYTQAYHDSRVYPQGVRSPQTAVQRAQVRRLLLLPSPISAVAVRSSTGGGSPVRNSSLDNSCRMRDPSSSSGAASVVPANPAIPKKKQPASTGGGSSNHSSSSGGGGGGAPSAAAAAGWPCAARAPAPAVTAGGSYYNNAALNSRTGGSCNSSPNTSESGLSLNFADCKLAGSTTVQSQLLQMTPPKSVVPAGTGSAADHGCSSPGNALLTPGAAGYAGGSSTQQQQWLAGSASVSSALARDTVNSLGLLWAPVSRTPLQASVGSKSSLLRQSLQARES